MARYTDVDGEYVVRRRPFQDRMKENISPYNDETAIDTDDDDSEEEDVRGRPPIRPDEGEEAWRNKEGERLADFGVDEDVDFYDEDENVPLAELIKRRQQIAKDN